MSVKSKESVGFRAVMVSVATSVVKFSVSLGFAHLSLGLVNVAMTNANPAIQTAYIAYAIATLFAGHQAIWSTKSSEWLSTIWRGVIAALSSSLKK